METKKEIFERYTKEYWAADKDRKHEILDAVCEMAKMHRKAAIRRFRKLQMRDPAHEDGRGGKLIYGADVTAALKEVWEAGNRVCAELLHPMIGEYVDIIVGLLGWMLIETLIAAPYFLSYYNEFAGGTWSGYHWATDSNYDWGQDLLRLQSFMDAHPEISQIAVGSLGRGDVHYYLGNRVVDWSSTQGNPANDGIHWFAISIDALELSTQPIEADITRNASDTYAWLTAHRPPMPGMGNVPMPDYLVGTTIFIYHL